MSDESAEVEEAAPVALDPLTSLLRQSRKDGAKPAAKAPAKAQAKRMPPAAPGDGTQVRGIPELFDVAATLGRNQRNVLETQPVDPGVNQEAPESALTTTQRIEQALAASSNVDFPTVTEICERIAAQPQEAKEAVELLVRVFSERNFHYRRRLKALTIMHELVYDENAAHELRAMPGALGALRDLQQAHNTGLGDDADGHIRMFATELERRCYGTLAEASADDDLPSRKRDKAMELFWELGTSVKANIAAAAGAVRGEELPMSSPASTASDANDRKKTLAIGLLRDMGSTMTSAVAALDSAVDNAIDYAQNYAATVTASAGVAAAPAARNSAVTFPVSATPLAAPQSFSGKAPAAVPASVASNAESPSSSRVDAAASGTATPGATSTEAQCPAQKSDLEFE